MKIDFENYLMEQYFREENPLDDESVEGFHFYDVDFSFKYRSIRSYPSQY